MRPGMLNSLILIVIVEVSLVTRAVNVSLRHHKRRRLIVARLELSVCFVTCKLPLILFFMELGPPSDYFIEHCYYFPTR